MIEVAALDSPLGLRQLFLPRMLDEEFSCVLPALLKFAVVERLAHDVA